MIEQCRDSVSSQSFARRLAAGAASSSRLWTSTGRGAAAKAGPRSDAPLATAIRVGINGKASPIIRLSHSDIYVEI